MPKILVVAGGGAAGFFSAVTAARLNPSLKVILVEKTGKLLSKVKVSGGGRCNVTHACFDIEEMVRKYPRGSRFLKKIFHQFFTTDTIQWFEERGVRLKTEADGRMFPESNSSQSIIDCLMGEAAKYGIEIRMHHEIASIQKDSETEKFRIEFRHGLILESDYCCIASGGYPKTTMFEWLLKTGHTIEEPVPSLFTFNMPGNPVNALMGISLPETEVSISRTKLKESGPLLITHWGMSGPAVLKLSAWGARILKEMDYRFEIVVNWMNTKSENEIRNEVGDIRHSSGAKKIHNKNPWDLPQRFWEYQLDTAGIGDIRWADLTTVQQNKLIGQLCRQEFKVEGKTTFKEEFVTAGGINLSEVNHQTMESKILPGLFFAGEVLDVDGITGGFNFQHAWSTGFIAGSAIAKTIHDIR